MPSDPLALAIVALGFLLGGLTKGTFGLGLPFVGVPIMAAAIPFQTAVAVFAIPTVTSNLQQTIQGRRIRAHVRRFWPLLLSLAVTTPFSAQWLIHISQATGLLCFGLLSVLFALMQMFPATLVVRPQQEIWLSPFVGFLAGLVSGVTGVSAPPLIAYLLALRLPKNEFVAAISLIYLVGSITLYGTLIFGSVLTVPVLIASAIGTFVVAAMIFVGQFIRNRIDEGRYRKIILGILFVFGLDMIRRGIS